MPTSCDIASKPPHIVLVHEESIVPPAYFPQLAYDRKVDDFFRSYDGKVHKMRVETYGGASWLTEFSLLAGVSTHSFGGMRQFVQTFTQSKLKDTLPQALAALRLPQRRVLPDDDATSSPTTAFYTSIGLTEIFDMKAQGAPTRRRSGTASTIGNALTEMERHFKNSQQAALHLHPDHVGALALRLQVRARKSMCRAAGRAPTRR